MARVTFRTTSGKVVSFPTKRRNPSRRFTVKKLAPKPRDVRGYRTLTVNARQRVRVALLRGGGTRAYELLTARKGAGR